MAILSDVHAYSPSNLEKGEKRPSYLSIGANLSSHRENPFAALHKLIDGDSLRADVLVSCGDIADKALPEATVYSWNAIKQVAKSLEVGEIVATCGNHDLDSRHKFNDFDARGVLLGLGDFPFDDAALTNEFWARNVVVLERKGYRFVVLNSAAYHGYNNEYEHGRISSATLQYLEARLKASGSKALNILVCHHHLSKTGAFDLADSSEMTDAGMLLELLNSTEHGRWLVVHGHRHWPYINYADGGASSPVIFSAGSLAAVLYDEIHDKARNQFYIVDLIIPANGSSVRGTFRAWDWISGVGFEPAQEGSGLPHIGGFGYREGGDAVAQMVIDEFDGSRKPFMTRDELVALIPSLDFLAPRDVKELKRCLEDSGKPILETDGRIEQIGRTP